MTNGVAAQIGSGTIPYTYGILPLDERGNEADGRGVRTGVQVMVGNPEDLVAVDAFATSGVTVGTGVVEILGPTKNPLPRSRFVTIQNTGANAVYISHRSSYPSIDSFELPAATAGVVRRITIPILHNVSVYAKTTTGTSVVRLLIV